MHSGTFIPFSVIATRGPGLGSDRPTTPEVRHQPLPLGSEGKEAFGPSPLLALVLAALVGLAVFALIWRARKTFGLKD